jgi:TolB protein
MDLATRPFPDRRRWRTAGAVRLATALFSIVTVTPAQAAFPGTNGKIAFASDRDGNAEIYAMLADGTGKTRLTTNPADDLEPARPCAGRS